MSHAGLGVPSPPSVLICCPQSRLCDIFQDHTQTVLLSGFSDVFPSGLSDVLRSGLSDVLRCGLSEVSLGFNSGWLAGHEAVRPVSCAGLTVGSVGCRDLFWVTLITWLEEVSTPVKKVIPFPFVSSKDFMEISFRIT